MKVHCLIALCLAAFLPCILGDYICTFPDYLSGEIDIGPTHVQTVPFYESIKDGLFEWNNYAVEVIDLKNRKRYLNDPAEGCFVMDLEDLEYYSYAIPDKGVPSGAAHCDGFTSDDPEVQCFIEHGEHVYWRYTVKMTGGGTCEPINILVNYHRYEHPITYEIKKIHVGTARGRTFYTDALNHVEFPCDLSQIVVS